MHCFHCRRACGNLLNGTRVIAALIAAGGQDNRTIWPKKVPWTLLSSLGHILPNDIGADLENLLFEWNLEELANDEHMAIPTGMASDNTDK